MKGNGQKRWKRFLNKMDTILQNVEFNKTTNVYVTNYKKLSTKKCQIQFK